MEKLHIKFLMYIFVFRISENKVQGPLVVPVPHPLVGVMVRMGGLGQMRIWADQAGRMWAVALVVLPVNIPGNRAWI